MARRLRQADVGVRVLPARAVTREFRYAVLGLGGIGSAALYRLAHRSAGEVIGFERFELGHARGASEDHSRIIRRSYHTPGYVRLADSAYRAWEEVERESGTELLVRTGGLDLWPAGAAIPAEDYTGSMRAEGVAFEELDVAEVMRRWPQWKLDDGTRAVFQEDGGLVAASRANQVHRDLAAAHGAVLRDRAPVTAIRDADGELELEAGGERYRVGTLVVSADAWTNEVLAMLGVRPLPLTITKEQVVYFDGPEDFSPERFPVWIWMDDPAFYGVPSFGEPGPKAGQDVGGAEIGDPDDRGEGPDPSALRRVRAFVEEHLPATGPVRSVKACTYAMPPDRDFVLDRLPEHPNVLVALGAAHGFKFAAWFGKALADLAVDARTDANLSAFAIDRPVLRMANPPKAFLV
jgi:sarcosine oxidase